MRNALFAVLACLLVAWILMDDVCVVRRSSWEQLQEERDFLWRDRNWYKERYDWYRA